MDYVKLGLFRIVVKILEVIYRLNLPTKMKIYPIQYIAILKLVYRDVKLLVYIVNTYRGQEKDKWEVLKIVSYKDINKEI